MRVSSKVVPIGGADNAITTLHVVLPQSFIIALMASVAANSPPQQPGVFKGPNPGE